MINKLMAKVFGTANEREVKRMQPRVERINALEPEMRKLSDAELAAKTDEFRARIQAKLAEIDAQNAKWRQRPARTKMALATAPRR